MSRRGEGKSDYSKAARVADAIRKARSRLRLGLGVIQGSYEKHPPNPEPDSHS
jgi:hypothetical protein